MCLPWNHKWGEWREVNRIMACVLSQKHLSDGRYKIRNCKKCSRIGVRKYRV